uniref:Uncharacterized protein n=1 Tax=Arundo donax TaxID=35708 RepID=A0A0A9DYL8_ARUDO
MRPPPAAPRR